MFWVKAFENERLNETFKIHVWLNFIKCVAVFCMYFGVANESMSITPG